MPDQIENSDELSRAKAQFREFMSLAVHDLRGPLRAIGVNADMLAGLETATAENTAESVRSIQGIVSIEWMRFAARASVSSVSRKGKRSRYARSI